MLFLAQAPNWVGGGIAARLFYYEWHDAPDGKQPYYFTARLSSVDGRRPIGRMARQGEQPRIAFAGRFGHCRHRACARQNPSISRRRKTRGKCICIPAPMPHGRGLTDFLYQRDGEIIAFAQLVGRLSKPFLSRSNEPRDTLAQSRRDRFRLPVPNYCRRAGRRHLARRVNRACSRRGNASP